ncbi:hypothetical protein J2X69_004820 [Algoriphagus sp. 4150]|nr:hypothetical protein [Algoriphagus sp. 4150]
MESLGRQVAWLIIIPVCYRIMPARKQVESLTINPPADGALCVLIMILIVSISSAEKRRIYK